MEKHRKLVFLGPPGCGKGTQAELIAKELKIKVMATGDMLREAIRTKSVLGKKAKSYVESGALVPDEIVIELISQHINDNNEFILDGFPRTVEQAKSLDKIIAIDKVIYFKCNPELIVKRLSGRRICPKCSSVYNLITKPSSKKGICDVCGAELEHRKDDKEEVILERLKVYETHTSPLLEFYRHKLVMIDANKGIDTIYRRLKEEIL